MMTIEKTKHVEGKLNVARFYKFAIVLGHAVPIPTIGAGGIEKVFWKIIHHWPQTSQVDLFARVGDNQPQYEDISDNARVIRCKGWDWHRSRPINALRALQWAMRLQPFLKHYDNVLYMTLWGPMLHKVLRKEGIVSWCDQRGTGRFQCVIRPFIDRVYAISTAVQERWKTIEEKSRIIPNCVDCERYIPGSPVEPYRIIFVGRIAKEKGLDVLIHALRLLHDSNAKLYLDVVGPGAIIQGGEPSYYEFCKDLTVKKGLTHHVIFHGPLSGNDLIELFQRSLLLCCPSVWPEAFGIVNIEALACGVPVIGSRVGAIPEIIDEGKSGYLVKENDPQAIADAIEHYLKLDHAAQRAMRENARMRAIRFDCRTVAKEYEEDLRFLCQNRKT